MNTDSPDIITTDVLVIGAGIAGMFAALQAREHGADVILVNKGIIGSDGASTWMAGPGFQVALYPPDSPEVHAKDTIKAGRFIGDQQIIFECTKYIPEIFACLSDWGVRYYQKNGKYYMRRLPGESFPRVPALERTGEYAGKEYKRVLTRRVKQVGVRRIDDVFTVDLLSNDNRIVGALGWDIRAGKMLVFQAKSTILATGGYIGCYPVTLAVRATGDGCAMAYRAGVEIADMEFVDFYTYVAIWPPAFRGDDWPAELVYNLGTKMYNRVGDEFRQRYSGALRNPPLAVASELRAGRGSPHGGIYLSLRHLPTNLVKDFITSVGRQKWMEKIKRVGFDLCNDAVEIAPAGITSFGGCKVDQKCQTSLDGLYAAGEVAAGKEGAYTMAGNSIPLSGAQGYLAGKEAALRAKGIALPKLNNAQIDELSERIVAPLKKEKGLRPFEVKNRIQNLLSRHAGLVERSDKGLREGLAEIDKFREEVLPSMQVASKSRRFDLDWIQALETRNITDIAGLILRSALERTESRGLHFREDFPEENSEWLKRVVIRRTQGQDTVSTEPVALTHLEPQEKGS